MEDDVKKFESMLLEKYADVLEFDESVLGDLDNKSPLSLNYYDGKLNLDVISVSQSKQNQGIGRSIMNDIIEFANANNLEIRVDSLADEFFKKMGFENYADEKGIIDEAQFRKLPDTPIQNRSNVMDYSKWTTEELFEEFKKLYYKTLAAEKDSKTIPKELWEKMNDMEWEEFSKARGYTEKEIKDYRKYMDISRELDSRLPLGGRGTTFTENFGYEHDIFGYDKTSIKDWEDYAMNIPDDISQIKDEEMLDKLDFTSPLEADFPDEDILPNLNPETKEWLEKYRLYMDGKNIPDDVSEIQEQDKETEDLRREGEKEITDPPDDLADGDAMTEQSLQEIEEELGEVDEDAIRKNIDDMPENTLSSIDPNAKAPDTVPEDLVEEVDRERFREFLELQEPEGTVLYDDAEIAEQAEANTRSRLTPQESDEFVDIVNQYNNQLDNVLENVPIEKAVKKRIRNKAAELSARLFTPGGPLIDALDFYETAVFGLGMIVAAAPELKNIASYYATLSANHIGKAYGMNIPVEKLEPDWERINKVMDQVEAVTPTDILINKVMDREQKGHTYVSSYLPGFLPQSTIKNDDVGTTLEKTLMNMPINKDKTETSSDKLKESLIYGSTK